MSVEDHGLEVLRKSGAEVTPGDRAEYKIRVFGDVNSSINMNAESDAAVFEDVQTTTTPGILQTLLTSAVGAGITRRLKQIIISCRIEGKFTIEDSGGIIGSGFTGASKPIATFVFDPPRKVVGTDSIVVKFISRTGSSASDVDCYLQSYNS